METPVVEPPLSPPWVTIWTRPRATIRRLVDWNPTYHIYLLAALGGASQGMDQITRREWVDVPSTSLLSLLFLLFLILFLAPLANIISMEISALLVGWAGRQLGGVASAMEVRTAIAWSEVPTVALLPLGVVKFIILAYYLLTTTLPRPDMPLLLVLPILLITGAEVIGALWSFVIYLQGVGEVHRFSAWRALGASLLPGLIILIPFVCLFFLIAALTR